MAETTDLQALERQADAARTRLANSLGRLTSPETATAAQEMATDYVQNLKTQALERVNQTKDELVERAKETAQQKAQGLAHDLKERALANPMGIALIAAGIGWRLYKKPPITTLLVGAGIATLVSGARARPADPSAYRAPYDPDQPRGYVPGGVAGYGYPSDAKGQLARAANQASAAVSRTGEAARDLAWDVRERVREAASDTAEHVAAGAENATSAASDFASRTAASVSGMAHNVAARASEALHQARDAALDTAHDLSAATESAADTVSRAAYHTASSMGDRANSATIRVTGVFEQARRNPALLGLAGVAAGVVAMRALSRTETGGRLIGQTGRTARGMTSHLGEAARRTGSQASHLASTATAGVTEAVSSGIEAASGLASSAVHLVSGPGSSAGREAGRGTESDRTSGSARKSPARSRNSDSDPFGRSPAQPGAVNRWLHDDVLALGRKYPFLLGAIGLSLGAAVGGSMRLTGTEKRVAGPLGPVMKRVRDIADERYADIRDTAAHVATKLTELTGRPEADDMSADFETVLGGGKPPAQANEDRGAGVEREAASRLGLSGAETAR